MRFSSWYGIGVGYQLIYVAPRRNVVVVRLGDRLDENVNWPLAIHNLIDQLP